MDRWMNGGMNGWMDECINKRMNAKHSNMQQRIVTSCAVFNFN